MNKEKLNTRRVELFRKNKENNKEKNQAYFKAYYQKKKAEKLLNVS